MTLATCRLGGQCAEYAATRILAPDQQLALAWDAVERVKPTHLQEWVDGSAISPGIAEQALESIAGEHQVLGFLRAKAVNAHRAYAGAVPWSKWAREARRRFADPCRGGWLAHGHAPLDGGRLVPVTFKPDRPRLDGDGDSIKYERPAGRQPAAYYAPLDQVSAERIAQRAGLHLPAELLLRPWDSWAAWCWLLAQPEVEITLDEGEKKSAAACSAGWLTIGLAGIYGGCPRPRDASGQPWGAPALIPDLAWLRTIRPHGAPVSIAFDASDKLRGRLDIRCARRRLGRLLEEHGHAVRIREMVQPEGAAHFVKGTDDLLAHGAAEALASLPVVPFEQWLREGGEAALRERLVHAFAISGGRRLRTVNRHFSAGDIPKTARLVALVGGMGTNKTGAVATWLQQRTGSAYSVTHRRSLADDQGRRFELAVLREGQVRHAGQTGKRQGERAPERIERMVAEHEGFVAVVDSFHPGGSAELRPEDCEGAVLFVDEADAFLRHVLTAQTAIAGHRCEALANLAACARRAAQIVLAGAQIDEITLQAFEQWADAKVHVVRSTLQPGAGRTATMLRTAEQLLQQARDLALQRRPFILHTSAKEAGSRWSPRNLAKLLHGTRNKRGWWPDAKVLQMDAQTIRQPGHPAAAAILDPARLLGFDVVLVSPVLETGFSIEDPHGHFAAVLGHSSGHTVPSAFVQSLGRLRSDAPRFLWCSTTGAKAGNGATFADEIERGKAEHAARLAEHLVDAGEQIGDPAAFLRLWAQVVADQNWQAGHYRHTVATLLGDAEGYEVHRLDQQAAESVHELVDDLGEARDETVLEESEAVAAAPRIDEQALEELKSRQRLTLEEQRQRERGQIERDLGLPAPTPEQVVLAREGARDQALLHLLTLDPIAREQWRRRAERELTRSQRTFAPDLTRAMAPWARATLLDGLTERNEAGDLVQPIVELLALAGTGRTVTMRSFERLHAAATAERRRWREAFGFDPGAGTTRTFVSTLLQRLGFELRRTDRRERAIGLDGKPRAYWHYEVVDRLRPLGRQQVQVHLAQGLAGTESVSFPL